MAQKKQATKKKRTTKKAARRNTSGAASGESPKVQLPYLNAYGHISRVLDKIKTAAEPSRFTQDFLSTKLGLSGGSARPLIPFLKRVGFLASDGTPTELYRQYRDSSTAGRAAATALCKGYETLFEMNEYAHELSDSDLRGLIVRATGLSSTTSTIAAILGSFKVLRDVASFDPAPEQVTSPTEVDGEATASASPAPGREEGFRGLSLGYTINLNLPATSDIAVFNAIFKSLREHLLKDLK
ncbi:MAG: DUF5343 domain-containing protein [Planctomycetota bacterium]